MNMPDGNELNEMGIEEHDAEGGCGSCGNSRKAGSGYPLRLLRICKLHPNCLIPPGGRCKSWIPEEAPHA